MKIYLLILALILPLYAQDTTKAVAQPRIEQFYSIHTGKFYEIQVWKKISPVEFSKMDTSSIYEHYRVEHTDQKTTIHRNFSTPSRDWTSDYIYSYNKDGKLTKIVSTFRTLSGIDNSNPEANTSPTTHTQTFTVSHKGTLTQTESTITDSSTKKKVNRSFYQPTPKHWMTLQKAPKPIKKP